MLDQLTAFIRDLRRAGIPVSITEEVDAARALRVTGMTSSSSFYNSLRCTLAKSRTSQIGFDPVFDAYFRFSASGNIDALSVTDDDIALGLAGAASLSDIATAVIDAHAGLESRSPVGVQYHVVQAMASLNRELMFERLLQRHDEQDALERLAAQVDLEARWSELEHEVEREVVRRVAATRGLDSVIADARARQSYNTEFSRATEREIAELRANLAPIARRLAIKLGRKRRSTRRGRLDFRNTMRHSLSYGGSTLELRFRRSAPTKPQLLVLADVSGSVAAFGRFTMQLVYALSQEFRQIRTFAFVDAVDEVTALLAGQAKFESAIARVADKADVVWRDGNSDYGHAFVQFWNDYRNAINSHTTVVILGDARTNYHAPHGEILRSIHRLARKVLWLNPEPQAYWGAGDSAMTVYAEHCDRVAECRNLRQLVAALDHLV